MLTDATIWSDLLTFLCHRDKVDYIAISKVLKIVDLYDIIPIVQVISILSNNTSIPLSVVKPMIMRRLQAENENKNKDEKIIEENAKEAKRLEEEMRELSVKYVSFVVLYGSPRVFQATRCTACSNPLDVPIIHFFCKHSFHQR